MTTLAREFPLPPFIAPNPVTYTIDLPFPPSSNKIWRQGRDNVYIAPEYKSWRANADNLAMFKRALAGVRTIRTAFEVHIYLDRDRSTGDLDNRIKCVLDWLQSREVISNDGLCVRLVAEWVSHPLAPEGCRVRVTERG